MINISLAVILSFLVGYLLVELYIKSIRLRYSRKKIIALKKFYAQYGVLSRDKYGMYHIKEINNWDGVPKPGLTWGEVAKELEKRRVDFGVGHVIQEERAECPECKEPLKKYESGEAEIIMEDGTSEFQPEVWGTYCPNGHFTHLTFA